jgi:hypothetical protein
MRHAFEHLLPLIIFGGGFSLIGSVLYGAWLLGRYRGREDNVPGDITRVEERIYRLEQVTAQMLSSVDRLESAQRMMVRTITEAPPPMVRASSLPQRPVTPH